MSKSAREAIKELIVNKTWWDKVDKMTDAQVIAIYMRARAQGKL